MIAPVWFTELVENPDPRGPFGAKEVGQGPLLPVMPAVANAVYDAIGVRIDEVPITPEKILRALDAKAAGKSPRFGPSRFPDIAWPLPLDVPPPWEGGDGSSTRLKSEVGSLTVADTARVQSVERDGFSRASAESMEREGTSRDSAESMEREGFSRARSKP